MKPSEAARATAEYFVDHPWTQGALIDVNGVCIAGALRVVVMGNIYAVASITQSNTISAVHVALRRRTGLGAAQYNDNVAESVDEVIHTLKLVVEDLELQEEGRLPMP